MNQRRRHRSRIVGSAVVSLVLMARAAVGQAVGQAEGTGGVCILATQAIGHLAPGRAFWHLSTYATRSEAELVRGAQGTAVASLGRVWLLTIADAGWRPSGGTHVAEIGPLPVTPDVAYTAEYMEAVFRPGMKSIVHRHSGPEAWYTLAGKTCLETPEGTMVGVVGGRPVIVPAGPPMELTATGTDVRRALVLILRDSEQPASRPAGDWNPKGLCKG